MLWFLLIWLFGSALFINMVLQLHDLYGNWRWSNRQTIYTTIIVCMTASADHTLRIHKYKDNCQLSIVNCQLL